MKVVYQLFMISKTSGIGNQTKAHLEKDILSAIKHKHIQKKVILAHPFNIWIICGNTNFSCIIVLTWIGKIKNSTDAWEWLNQMTWFCQLELFQKSPLSPTIRANCQWQQTILLPDMKNPDNGLFWCIFFLWYSFWRTPSFISS